MFQGVVDPEGAFVVGGEVVFGRQPPEQPLLEIVHRLVGVDALYGNSYGVYLQVVGLVDKLSGRQRDVARGVGALRITLVDTHDRECQAVEFDLLA